MTSDGELGVRLNWDGRQVTHVEIRSTRSFAAPRILAGKTPSRAAAMVAMLYSVCGVAQRAAANGALDAAGASDVNADPLRSERAVALETIQEHFWRLLIDWPQAVGRQADATPVAMARYRIAAAAGGADGRAVLDDGMAMVELGNELSRLAEKAVYGKAPAEWLTLATLPELDDWAADGATEAASLLREIRAQVPMLGRSDASLMPETGQQALLDVIRPALDRDPDYARRPTWNGRVVETGALARVRMQPLVAAMIDDAGHSVATRLVARLVDLAMLLAGFKSELSEPAASPRIQSFAVSPNGGIASVQTARGLLVHQVELEGGCVADYRIVAPTEWNCHPQGALAQGLAQITVNDWLSPRQQARLVVQALDPCVASHVEVAGA